MVALSIGMGLWWNYFDLLGRRVPARSGAPLAGWLFAHLPLTMAIAAGGAAMVSLVEHAGDSRAPAATAWLLTGSVAVMLLAVTFAARALPDDAFPSGMRAQVAPTFALAAVAILVTGSVRPAPLVLVAVTSIALSVAWLRLVVLYLALGGRLGRPQEELPHAG